MHDYALDEEIRPTVFVPYSQAGPQTSDSLYLVTRTAAGAPSSFQSALETAVHEIDRNLPVSDVQTMQDRLRTSLSRRSFTMWLLCLFAISGLILATP
ncbi:MAG TPA: hypothetical protein VI756_21520 [Blastocatellia bacterium]